MSPKTEQARANPRTCIGCRRVVERSDLIRIHLDAEGRPRVGLGGRGAWLCRETVGECLERAVARNAISRAFRLPVPASSLDRLRVDLGLG